MKILLLIPLVLLVSCTTVVIETPDATVRVTKFHPMGEELNIDGTLKDIGSLKIDKSTENSTEVTSILTDALIRAATIQAAP